MPDFPTTDGRRHAERVSKDNALIKQIIDSNFLGHLGVVQDGFPIVIPTGYVRIGDQLYLHGAAANQAMKLAVDSPLSFCITSVQGMVLATTMFNHSFNYESVIIFAVGKAVTDLEQKDDILVKFVDSMFPHRSDRLPKNTRTELLSTSVVAIDLDRASAKVRTNPPELDERPDAFVGTVEFETQVVAFKPVIGSIRNETEIDSRLRLRSN